MREVKLPSGSVLKIVPAPFSDAKALYQAVLKELKTLTIDPKSELGPTLYKDLFCTGLASLEIEKCLWECFKRCLYNDLKIDANTFEPVEKRDDYWQVCIEVAQDNILPFAKSLYAKYLPMFRAALESIQR